MLEPTWQKRTADLIMSVRSAGVVLAATHINRTSNERINRRRLVLLDQIRKKNNVFFLSAYFLAELIIVDLSDGIDHGADAKQYKMTNRRRMGAATSTTTKATKARYHDRSNRSESRLEGLSKVARRVRNRWRLATGDAVLPVIFCLLLSCCLLPSLGPSSFLLYYPDSHHTRTDSTRPDTT